MPTTEIVATQTERLNQLKDFLGKTVTEMSKDLGIPRPSMSMYLLGERQMKQWRIHQVAKTYLVDESWLMGFDVPMRQSMAETVTKGDELILLINYRRLTHDQQIELGMIAKKMAGENK